MNDVDRAYHDGYKDGFNQALADLRLHQASYEIIQILENKLPKYLDQED